MSLDELWKKYKKTNDIQYKRMLIEEYIPLVKIVAGRMYNYYGSKIEFDDLLGYGVLGLIDSIDKFDIDRNYKFETYAQIRIRGAIIDNVRKFDWIPRTMRKKSKEIQNAIFELENILDREVTNEDIANKLNISKEEVDKVLANTLNFNIVSLEEILSNKGEVVLNSSTGNIPDSVYEANELKKMLAEIIDELPKKERIIISLYYYNELTYREIGEILNLSESRISQLHSRAIIKIKNGLLKEGIEG